MRICYVARSVLPSRQANSVHVMKMCQAYARLGHEVLLLVPRYPGRPLPPQGLHAYYGVADSFEVRRVRLPDRLPGTLTYGVVLPLVARRWRPDLVHARSLTAAWGAATLFRLPTVYELHDAPSAHPRPRRMLERLSRSPRLRALVVISRALAERVTAELPVAPVVSPDGVDEDLLRQPLEREEARRRLGLEPGDQRLAVYTGHLYPGRGIGLILDLARRHPDHLFLLVGGTEEDLAARRRQAADLPNVRFAGFQSPARIPLYLFAADVLLMPYGSRVEVAGGGDTAAFASPLKMFEYLAAGRPILSSTLPVLREVLENGGNALLLDHDRPQAWSAALERLRDDPELAATLSCRGRSDARRYTWTQRARDVLAAARAGIA